MVGPGHESWGKWQRLAELGRCGVKDHCIIVEHRPAKPGGLNVTQRVCSRVFGGGGEHEGLMPLLARGPEQPSHEMHQLMCKL